MSDEELARLEWWADDPDDWPYKTGPIVQFPPLELKYLRAFIAAIKDGRYKVTRTVKVEEVVDV